MLKLSDWNHNQFLAIVLSQSHSLCNRSLEIFGFPPGQQSTVPEPFD